MWSYNLNYDLKAANIPRWPYKNKQLTDDHRRKSIRAFTCLVRPKSVGTLKLKSADPLDHPLIDPNYFSHPDDFQAFVEGFVCLIHCGLVTLVGSFLFCFHRLFRWKIFAGIYEQDAMKAAGAEVMKWAKFESHEEAGKYLISNNALTIYHPVGTCKMGNLQKDEMAVCSERLKVRGFKNLRVADASIAPDLVAANTQAMCTLIGCKAAKMVMEDWSTVTI